MPLCVHGGHVCRCSCLIVNSHYNYTIIILYKYRCSIVSLLPYTEDTLSVFLCYLPREQQQTTPTPLEDDSCSDGESSDVVYHYAVGQLPVECLVSCVLGVECVESVDVGAVLTQVCVLGAYKAGSLAVSGSRKVAAVVSHISH